MDENDLVTMVLDACFKIHKETGPGLYESVYESILEYELIKKYGLKVRRQPPIPVIWNEIILDLEFRADLIIEDKLIVEIKSVEALGDIHAKEVLTYLRLTNLKLGLIINFNEVLLKKGIKRVANNL